MSNQTLKRKTEVPAAALEADLLPGKSHKKAIKRVAGQPSSTDEAAPTTIEALK